MTGLRVAPGVPQPETLRSRPIVMAVACAAAVVFGIFLPVAPSLALAAVLLVPLALAAPLAALSMLVAVTVLVPFEVQDAFAVMGGRDQPGLLVVDAIMVVALAGMAWRAARRRLDIDTPLIAGLLVALIVTVALIWGVANGAALSEAGHETRHVALGVGTFLLARPLLVTQSGRKRLIGVLIGVGLALGVWGLAQWFFSVGYTTSGDVGVRPSDDPTSPGLMQLQGGMYAFPVAVTLAWAALASGQVRSARVRYVLGVIMLLNGMCVVLTFERTIWAVTAVACALVAVTSGASARRLAIRWAPAAGMALLIIFLSAGSEVSSALKRLVLLGEVSSDTSFTFRLVESQAVAGAIVQQPVTGSGFGATITWGARDTFSTVTTPFVHNGYLWLAWKIGVPAAALVVLLLGRAIVRRTPPGDVGHWKALRVGSRASLLALMLVGLTFPIFNALGITSAMGLLAAVCFSDAPPDAPLSKE
jgi:hypothetical protein